jgi:hypothetical protein
VIRCRGYEQQPLNACRELDAGDLPAAGGIDPEQRALDGEREE